MRARCRSSTSAPTTDAAPTRRCRRWWRSCIAESGETSVVNGRFKGGYITRHYGDPAGGVHALQMELSCRFYLREPVGPVGPAVWPAPYDADYAAPARRALARILEAALGWARS